MTVKIKTADQKMDEVVGQYKLADYVAELAELDKKKARKANQAEEAGQMAVAQDRVKVWLELIPTEFLKMFNDAGISWHATADDDRIMGRFEGIDIIRVSISREGPEGKTWRLDGSYLAGPDMWHAPDMWYAFDHSHASMWPKLAVNLHTGIEAVGRIKDAARAILRDGDKFAQYVTKVTEALADRVAELGHRAINAELIAKEWEAGENQMAAVESIWGKLTGD